MKILMVCLGNICRSPIAQGILEQKIKKNSLNWETDSAGTSGWHDGEAPDQRAIETCRKKGIDISRQISRKIKQTDLDEYDLILAMDTSNYRDIMSMCKNESHKQKVNLIMNFKFPDRNIVVPDPYYDNRFEEVYDILDDVMDYLIEYQISIKT